MSLGLLRLQLLLDPSERINTLSSAALFEKQRPSVEHYS